jgi:EmrB/QacA subfamily drug resistance transporter
MAETPSSAATARMVGRALPGFLVWRLSTLAITIKMNATMGKRAPAGRLRAGRAALAVLCTAQFVDVLDVNVVLVALPAIGRDLGLAAGELQWVVTAYALTFAGFLLLAGRLADLLGASRLFMAGLALFALASLACGLAREPLVLILGRAAQGLGAAITAPAALAIITTSFREGPERDRAVGAWTAVAAAGGAAGVVAGGAITASLGWQWVFFVNVPVGLAALAPAPFLLPAARPGGRRADLDLLGAATVTAGLALLVFAFSHAQRQGLGSAGVLAPLVLSASLLAAFVLVERRAAAPLVPLRMFGSQDLVAATLTATALTAATSAGGVVATLYLQGVLGYSPAAAGLAALPVSLSVIAGSIAGPRAIRQASPRATMVLGLLGVCAGALVATRISATAGLGYVLAGGVLEGFGLGLASVAATASGTATVADGERGLASGVLTTAAQVGTAVGVSALVWLATARAEALVPGDPSPAALVSGYRWAFVAAAAIAALAALAIRALRPAPR